MRITPLHTTGRVLVAATILLVARCSASSPRAASAPAAEQSRERRTTSDPSRLTCAEIQAVGGSLSALDLVERLRPAWLVKRGQVSIYFEPDIGLVIDRQRLNSVQQLRNMPTAGIRRMERLRSEQAKEFGEYPHGVIVVDTGAC
jgi:hypothetical protein